MRTRQTWVDVTDLLKFAARPTGIPRVRAALAIRYAADPDTRFFSYQDDTRLFLEVPRAVVQRNASRLARDGTAPAAPRPTTALARRTSAFATARTLVRRLPAPIVDALRRARGAWRSARKSVTATADAIGKGARDLGRMLSAPVRRRVSGVTFEPNDRVVVFGNGWMEPSLQSELGRIKRTTGIRVYQILYDLSPIRYPQTYGGPFAARFPEFLDAAMSISDGLVAISEHTRSDGLRYCAERHIPPPPMAVMRLADEPGSIEPEPIDQLAGEDFVVAVGTFELRKNYVLLYQAWRLAAERGVALPRMVIVGGRGWGAADTRNAIPRDPMVKESILIFGNASDGQLEWLYRNCRLTVYPSLYEGWGMPIAESLAHGKLCLASSSSAMREVAGDLIDYFSPFSPDELLGRITPYLDDDRLARKEAQIRETYRLTTWDQSFKQFVGALDAFEREGA